VPIIKHIPFCQKHQNVNNSRKIFCGASRHRKIQISAIVCALRRWVYLQGLKPLLYAFHIKVCFFLSCRWSSLFFQFMRSNLLQKNHSTGKALENQRTYHYIVKNDQPKTGRWTSAAVSRSRLKTTTRLAFLWCILPNICLWTGNQEF